MSKKIIVWFRTDLRIHDHHPLHTAWKEDADILPIYVFDPQFFGKTAHGFPKTGSFRTQFLLESVSDLKDNIQKLGSNLVIRFGNSAEEISKVASSWKATHIYFYDDPIHEEAIISQQVIDELAKLNIQIKTFWGQTLIAPENLSFGLNQCPDLFSDFRKRVEKNTIFPDPLKSPENLRLAHDFGESDLPTFEQLGVEKPIQDSRAVLSFKGGETEALNRLQSYFWTDNHLKNYKLTRNGMLGADYSSKFSAWLANGCISARKIFYEVEKYERQIIRNESTYWLVFELLWRDYFRMISHKYGARIFLKSGISDFLIDSTENETYFQLWKEGKTGYPLVDANMRELSQTGFMSNRGRQNVASFLTKNLGLDWRLGAEWFESLLIDYDPASNYGNWNYAAGVGFDTRGFRFFNITSQSQEYDPKAEYIKHWLPELAKIPHNRFFELWKVDKAELQKYGVILGENYPKPIVDLFESAKKNEIAYKYALQKNNYRPPSLIRKFANFSN